MTAPALLAWISLAIGAQVLIGVLIAVRQSGESESPVVAPRASDAAWAGERTFRVVAREVEDPSRSQCSFQLVPLDGAALPPYRPGQFLTLVVPIAPPRTADGAVAAVERLMRCYSLSDAPRPDRYRITVKRALAPSDRPDVPAGIVSGYLHDQVTVGSTLEVRAPSGQFVLDGDATVPLVLIGGGIGVTPLLSMLLWILEAQPERDVTLFHGVRSSADHAFKVVLRELANAHPTFHLHVLYGAPDVGDVEGRDYDHRGMITLPLIESVTGAGRHRYYVCGPPPMMALIVPGLAARGVAPDDIRSEAFGPASVPRAPFLATTPAVALEVRFRAAGRTIMWDGAAATLLDLAESNGITIPAGCRSGSCGTCETRLVTGRVGYPDAPAYRVTPGFCLPCVAVPESALVLGA